MPSAASFPLPDLTAASERAPQVGRRSRRPSAPSGLPSLARVAIRQVASRARVTASRRRWLKIVRGRTEVARVRKTRRTAETRETANQRGSAETHMNPPPPHVHGKEGGRWFESVRGLPRCRQRSSPASDRSPRNPTRRTPSAHLPRAKVGRLGSRRRSHAHGGPVTVRKPAGCRVDR